ncbi:PREDICTED: histone H1.4-like [Galeopterus variegatus]|uniref:Histone H1.4-like n=1 Tax=Galeopterus variegatus TaxID=482537 RepID=A0ABM0QCI2_GALVR|nr:PREDICTED: histone H1.4-like [Galeopterus variegatus]
MFEIAPATTPARSLTENTFIKKKVRKPAGAAKHKASEPRCGRLISKALGTSKERSGVSLAELKELLLATTTWRTKEKRHPAGPSKSLVTNGTLVQMKRGGASGSFKLNKAVSGEAKPKAKKAGAAKAKTATRTAKRPNKATKKRHPEEA